MPRTCKHCAEGIHGTFNYSRKSKRAKSTMLYYLTLFFFFYYFCKIHLNVTLPVLRSPNLSLPSRFSDSNFRCFICTSYLSAHTLVLGVTNLLLCGGGYQLLCSGFYSLAISSQQAFLDSIRVIMSSKDVQ